MDWWIGGVKKSKGCGCKGAVEQGSKGVMEYQKTTNNAQSTKNQELITHNGRRTNYQWQMTNDKAFTNPSIHSSNNPFCYSRDVSPSRIAYFVNSATVRRLSLSMILWR